MWRIAGKVVLILGSVVLFVCGVFWMSYAYSQKIQTIANRGYPAAG
jgi:biotin transporter BioY